MLKICILSTKPIDAAWKNAAIAHHRFDFNTWYLSYSVVSIFFDLVILCFPITVIRTLRVTYKQKLSIIGVFWLGGFVCVSAIVRFVLLYNSIYKVSDYGKNQYSTFTPAFIWAEVEPNMSVIAACLPTYGPLFKNGGIFPRMANSIKSMFGYNSEAEKSPSGTRSSAGFGYYELDKPSAPNKNDGGVVSHHSLDCEDDLRADERV
jgi:hypothetical protein